MASNQGCFTVPERASKQNKTTDWPAWWQWYAYENYFAYIRYCTCILWEHSQYTAVQSCNACNLSHTCTVHILLAANQNQTCFNVFSKPYQAMNIGRFLLFNQYSILNSSFLSLDIWSTCNWCFCIPRPTCKTPVSRIKSRQNLH